jgi:hypothetical protein
MGAIAAGSCRLFAALVVLVSLSQEAAGRADSAEWVAAKQLMQQIQAPIPALSETERAQFLKAFAAHQARHDRLEADEQNLVARLNELQRALRARAAEAAQHGAATASWQAQRDDHFSRCNRTFTNPADVAACNREGDKLTADKAALDQRERELARQAEDLRGRQVESTRLVAALDRDYAAWARSVETDFNARLRTALGRKIGTTTLRLTVKTFIQRVDLSSMSAEHRSRLERTAAGVVNLDASENPATPAAEAKDFRLWSQVEAVVTCKGDTIAGWRTSDLTHRGGKEFGIFETETAVLENLKIVPGPHGTGERKAVDFSYAIKGRPNQAGVIFLRNVNPRTCAYIWHRVHGVLTCQGGTAQLETKLTGSRFPSHRAWTNNEVRNYIEQGPFHNLWDCQTSAPELVR